MWRKRLRLGIAVFGIGLAAFVVSVTRPRESRTAPPPVARLDPSATVETRGCEVVQLRGAKQDLRVECASQVTYQDGRTALVGVTLRVDNRAGRNFEVRSQEASVGARQSSFDMKGDVRLEASDGLVATAGSASYVADEGIVRAPGPVQFSRERMAGTGIGFTYDEQRNTLWLLDQAVVRLAADGAAGAMDIAAGTAGFARAERYLRFERGVRMTRSGQVIEADEATVFLFADRDEPDRIELRGNARITGGEGMGALRLMRARDIN
ncbi:MAG: LPS export ABC transporter periplasmic protein LptC, partial [Acidobacteria bacterium]|nr:LPS export ABC transporter periplasmic protein LptC [Acidobacteriota bacterium]